jgi:hypothetical protein
MDEGDSNLIHACPHKRSKVQKKRHKRSSREEERLESHSLGQIREQENQVQKNRGE